MLFEISREREGGGEGVKEDGKSTVGVIWLTKKTRRHQSHLAVAYAVIWA